MMKIIAIKDPKVGGYTAYHEDFPAVVVESENLENIKEKISNVFYDIVMNSEIKEIEIKDVSNEQNS